MKILVTGASGFVGSRLCSILMERDLVVVGAVRRLPKKPSLQMNYQIVTDLGRNTNWNKALAGVNVVAHCAARVHIMCETAADPLMTFREVNVEGTIRLAKQAASNGVKRFIHISSIKVNGESTSGYPFKADDTPAPEDSYGISKWETEQALQKISSETGLDVVIIRPPLVYGPGVGANFLRLMQMVRLSIPLPFGAINNRRSLVALDNLVDLIVTCMNHPAATNETFLVSDGEDLSTTELLRRTAKAFGKPALLIPVPASLLWATARLFGKLNFAQRLCGSLQVDISKARRLLAWVPPVSVDEALKKTAQHFLAS